MYCRYCGSKIKDNAKFCSNCGSALNLDNDLHKENSEVMIHYNKNASIIIYSIIGYSLLFLGSIIGSAMSRLWGLFVLSGTIACFILSIIYAVKGLIFNSNNKKIISKFVSNIIFFVLSIIGLIISIIIFIIILL